MNSLVLDNTALLALGAGNHFVSTVVEAVHRRRDWYVAAPALCLVAAAAQRPGLNDHVGMLAAVDVVALDFTATGAVSYLVHAGVDWRAAHAVQLGRPSPQWPEGTTVATTTPEVYAAWGVRTVTVEG